MGAADQKTQHCKNISPIFISIFIKITLRVKSRQNIHNLDRKAKVQELTKQCRKLKVGKPNPHDATHHEGMVGLQRGKNPTIN